MEKKELQWIKGDHIGTVETLDKTEDEWTYFKSGRRIKSDLINEFMISEKEDIGSPRRNKNPSHQQSNTNTYKPNYNFEDNNDNVITDPDTGESIDVAQLRHKERQESINKPKELESVNTTEQSTPNFKKKKEGPITLLINKSKKDTIKVNYEFDIEIPKKSVYDIIEDSFDTNLNQEIIDVVLASIDIKTLKESVEESINNTIKNYYKSK